MDSTFPACTAKHIDQTSSLKAERRFIELACHRPIISDTARLDEFKSKAQQFHSMYFKPGLLDLRNVEESLVYLLTPLDGTYAENIVAVRQGRKRSMGGERHQSQLVCCVFSKNVELSKLCAEPHQSVAPASRAWRVVDLTCFLGENEPLLYAKIHK